MKANKRSGECHPQGLSKFGSNFELAFDQMNFDWFGTTSIQFFLISEQFEKLEEVLKNQQNVSQWEPLQKDGEFQKV